MSNKNDPSKFQRVINYFWGLVCGSLVVHIVGDRWHVLTDQKCNIDTRGRNNVYADVFFYSQLRST